MQQTIYFRKEIWEKFQSVEDKSKLINELLEQFYTPKPSSVLQPNTTQDKDEIDLDELDL